MVRSSESGSALEILVFIGWSVGWLVGLLNCELTLSRTNPAKPHAVTSQKQAWARQDFGLALLVNHPT
jgi:hypothetical protein